ncbi:hypothetical protein BDZ89DRAFT_1117260 [Hymenopellis radicata]|nr:hypothetical protein BDZ89DRAFT_1117260 [Hymenopellis radicata]
MQVTSHRRSATKNDSDADYLTCRVPEHLWGALEPLYKGLPPEIFDVIISHLEPLDLLHLRCTDKAFRALVHGNPVSWRQARENLRTNNPALPVLPPVPKGMSEASFMNIMFRNWMTCNCKELARRRGRLHAPCCRTCLYNRHRSEWPIHYIDLKIKDKEYSFRKQCAAFLDAWIIARERRKVAQAASDKALIQWCFMDIIKRLNAQGCRKDVEWRDTKSVIRASRYSCRPERITPFIWKNKLEPKFMALIEDVRVRRHPEVIAERREEFLRLYKQALTSLHLGMPHLNAIDIAHCPPFTSLMKLIDEAHINQEIRWIPARDFEQAVATAHKNLLGSMDTQLLTLIKDHGLPPTREELTVTRFKCDKCATIVAYPAVLVHSCRRGRDCNAEDQLVLDSKYCWRSDVFILLEASATRRMLRSLPVIQWPEDQPLYICRLCHDEATTFNSNTLPLMTWREAAKHDNHDDWMFVREPASIIFGQIRMEVEVGPQWRRRNVACVTIHGVQYEIQGDEIVHLSEMAE